MTKEEARKHLTDYIERTRAFYQETVQLPIYDQVVHSKIDLVFDTDGDVKLEQWTFRGLLKIAYDLEDKV